MSEYQYPKWPRATVSGARHRKLFMEAKKEGVSMEALVEAKLKLADKVLRGLKKNAKLGIIN